MSQQTAISPTAGEPSERPVRPVPPTVEVTGVGYAFMSNRPGRKVLDGVDLILEPGDFVVLAGPSGAGKTTLLSLIGALRAIQDGDIRLDGTPLKGLGQGEMERHSITVLAKAASVR